MALTVERSRPAMGSLFQVRLVGDDAEHLAAVAEAALDEIERIDRLLSWRDHRSQCARLNREAGEHAVLVDYEMLGILQICRDAWAATDGYFDVAAGSANHESEISALKFEVDPAQRFVRFASPTVRLDFGAFGKGYALDVAAAEVRRFGVVNGLLDGGTSSVLALGRDEQDRPWPVGLRNPFPPQPDRRDTWSHELRQLRLSDAALSCSATYDANSSHSAFPIPHSPFMSDLVDPHTGRPIAEAAACAVAAASAATAEILSTALLCMGKTKAAAYTRTESNPFLDAASLVVWINRVDGVPRVETLLQRRTDLVV